MLALQRARTFACNPTAFRNDDMMTMARAASMRPPQHAREGHQEELFAVLAAHMQDPGTPIIRTMAADVVSNDLHSPLVRLDQILDVRSSLVEVEPGRIGTMEINVCHGRHPIPQGLFLAKPDSVFRLNAQPIVR
jgi:hypothetical protein